MLTHFVDTTATLFLRTQQKVGGHTSAMIDNGGLTFTAKAVDGDGDASGCKTVTFSLSFLLKDLMEVIDHCSTLSGKIHVQHLAQSLMLHDACCF